jgi:hypothetical protein
MSATTPRRLVGSAATLALACAAMLTLQPPSAVASTSATTTVLRPKTFTWSATHRAPNGTVYTLSVTFSSRPKQATNPVKLVTHLQVTPPIWPVGGRSTLAVTTEIPYHSGPGRMAVWTVRHSSSECVTMQPTAGSAMTCEWTDLPQVSQIRRLERSAEDMVVEWSDTMT